MDNVLYKKILASLLSVFLIIGCVTYQPAHTEAFAGKVASYAAKKAAQWVAKESIADSVKLILKKKVDVTDPLFEKYLARVDYDLVHIDGKTFLMRNNLGAAENAALKEQVGKVIDRMMYGENAAWLSWVDWWSVGPMILVGNILFSEMSDESYSFIDDVIKQAMIDLGFLALPESNFTDSKTNEPVKHYDTPPVTSDPVKNKNYSGSFDSSVVYGTNTQNMPLEAAATPFAPYMTYVVEVVPKSSVSSLTDSNIPLMYSVLELTDRTEYSMFNFDMNSSVVFRNNIANDAYAPKKIYRNSQLVYSGTKADLSSNIPIAHLRQMNRQIMSIDSSTTPIKMTYILQSTVDSSIPTYKIVITRSSSMFNASQKIAKVGSAFYPSNALKTAGYTVHWDYFTDRVITPPSPRPAPQLTDVKADKPQDYVQSPVINKSPSGKPTMAIPVTTIVQDPTVTPVKPGPTGGIVITKPDGTEVTDPDTELDPVTNVPVVQPNPTTDEPEIIPSPNTPPEPAIPPSSDPEPNPDPPTDDDSDTGDPPTGDDDTDTPPDDPDDEDPSKVKWDKLKTIPNFMTTRFPFSLPWDIGRFMDAVFPDVTPISELVFEFPDIGEYNTSFEIRIPEYFDPWLDFARAAFIYGFDISLVYAIYRLFGGAQ